MTLLSKPMMNKKTLGGPFDFSQLPLTNKGLVPEEYESHSWWRGVTWHKTMFARATPPTLGMFGMDSEYMRSHQAGFFMLQAHIKSPFPLTCNQQFNVYSRLINRTEKRFHFIHLMTIDEQAELAATCEVIGAHMDLTRRRMAPLPHDLAERFDQVLSCHRSITWQPPVCGALQP